MSALDPSQAVGQLVTERPARSRVFEQFRIDYCCGGRRSLEDACAKAGVDPSQVLEAIRKADADTDRSGTEETNWAEESSADLVNHIVFVHHAFLRQELPRLSGLLDKVVAAHGSKHAELAEVQTTYEALREELEQHMLKEENILFPAIVQAGSAPFPSFDGPISVMEHEHDSAGRALGRLRELTADYTPPDSACNTYRAMLDGLKGLEGDLHRHIHKENNILFPRFATSVANAD